MRRNVKHPVCTLPSTSGEVCLTTKRVGRQAFLNKPIESSNQQTMAAEVNQLFKLVTDMTIQQVNSDNFPDIEISSFIKLNPCPSLVHDGKQKNKEKSTTTNVLPEISSQPTCKNASLVTSVRNALCKFLSLTILKSRTYHLS